MSTKFCYTRLAIEESDLKDVRRALYHSSGPGYFIVKNFIPDDYVDHMQKLWVNLEPERYHKKFIGKEAFVQGCGNFVASDNGGENLAYHNFFWNAPVDELTHSVSMYIHFLRNRIEGLLPFREMIPLGSRMKATNYRLVISRNGKAPVPVHVDIAPEDRSGEVGILMCTLFLSKKGKDYTGEGFAFRTNQGERIVFDEDVDINPGDLLIWRHLNEHSVLDIRSTPDQMGFVRMLFPREYILQSGAKRFIKFIRHSVATSAIGKNILKPVYRRLRG